MGEPRAKDEAVWKKLKSYLDRTSKKHESIVECSDFMRQNCKHDAARCVRIWHNEFKKQAHRQLLYLYVANDVMQKDKEGSFVHKFHQVMGFCLYRFSQSNPQFFDKAKRMIGLWEQRNVLTTADTLKLRQALAGRDKDVVETVEAREDTVTGGEDAEEVTREDGNLEVFQAQPKVEWEGGRSLEEVKESLDEVQGYLGGLEEKAPAVEVQKEKNPNTLKFAKVLAALDASQAKSIQDDLVEEKLARDKETFLTIKANVEKEGKEDELKEFKDGDIKEETDFYRIKVVEEKFELSLNDFAKLIADYKGRMDESFSRWEKEMELVEEAYETAETEVKSLDDFYVQFREDCKAVARANQMVSKQARERKRKREMEIKKREDEEKRKRQLELESQRASQAFFQNFGAANSAVPQPPQQHVSATTGTAPYSYGSYAATANAYSYQSYGANPSYMAPTTATSNTTSSVLQTPYQQHPLTQASTVGQGSNQNATNQYGQQYQSSYSQYTQGYNSYSNQNTSQRGQQ